MLTQVITRRFVRHHDRVLAFVDALEGVIQEMVKSPQPLAEVKKNHSLLWEFCEFIETDGLQHEKEEERVLIPVLKKRLEKVENPLPESSIDRICSEHGSGARLVEDLKRQLRTIESGNVGDGACDRLSAILVDVIWHFRRHIWAESLIILPTARKLIPDSSDDLWNLNRTRRGFTDA